jgi:hypothetical protein
MAGIRARCSDLRKSIEEDYTINDSGFFEYDGESKKERTFDILLNEGVNEVMNVLLTVNQDEETVYINNIERTGAKKGTGRDLIYLIGCKTVELGYSLVFLATPYSKKNTLFKYYNSLGLQRFGNTRETRGSLVQEYRTTNAELKKLLNMDGGKRRTRRVRRGSD